MPSKALRGWLAVCRNTRRGLRSVQGGRQEAPHGFRPGRLGFRLLGDPGVKLAELIGLETNHNLSSLAGCRAAPRFYASRY